MRIRGLCLPVLAPHRALAAAMLLVAWPVGGWAETETPPPSRLRDPLSGVTRFLGYPPHAPYQRRHRVVGLSKREAPIHVIRHIPPEPAVAVPVYAYAYGYVSYDPYTPLAWARYRYRRYAYYYSPIPGYAGY